VKSWKLRRVDFVGSGEMKNDGRILSENPARKKGV
jgi:hypothetical protein